MLRWSQKTEVPGSFHNKLAGPSQDISLPEAKGIMAPAFHVQKLTGQRVQSYFGGGDGIALSTPHKATTWFWEIRQAWHTQFQPPT